MITQGGGSLGRIYERLRKRSLRKRGDLDDSYASMIGDVAHQYYLKGVLEALQAVQDLEEFTCSSCGWRIVGTEPAEQFTCSGDDSGHRIGTFR